MSDLLDRAFPYTEEFDAYADRLFFKAGSTVGTGINAANLYYDALRKGIPSEEAFTLANTRRLISPEEAQRTPSHIIVPVEQTALFEPAALGAHFEQLGGISLRATGGLLKRLRRS